MLSGYLGKSATFDRALAEFSVAYADQNERDHPALEKAVRSGKVKAVFEELKLAVRNESRTARRLAQNVDLLPAFRTSPSMISDEGKGKRDVEEQAHGSADDRGAEAARSGT